VGLVLGFCAAIAGTYAWNLFGAARRARIPERETTAQVDLFRLPSGARREMFFVPAGADADGEPALSRALFPDEEPPRELASLLIANVSADEPWQVDLAKEPLSCRVGERPDLASLDRVSSRTGASLPPAQLLRLRALSSDEPTLVVAPSSLRRVLYALPPRCRMGDLSVVQWGSTPLVRDRLDLERVRHFREDPAAVTTGR
jgi:hypothetical protein